MTDTLDGIETLGPWLSSLIVEEDDPEEPNYTEVSEQLQKKVLDKFEMFKEPYQRKLMGNHMAKKG